MSYTKFNKNGTISIYGLEKDEYDAIRKILFSSKQCFDEKNEYGEYYSNDDFVCALTEKEKEALHNLDI